MKTEGPRLFVVWILLCARGLPCSGAEVSKMAAAETQPERFVENGDGTVTDTQTGLMWAARDNGIDVTWYDAGRYCENYVGGEHSDWRMPTKTELITLYHTSYSQTAQCSNVSVTPLHVSPLIDISCYVVWSQTLWLSPPPGLTGPLHIALTFDDGTWHPRFDSSLARALPVRAVKK